MGIVMAKCPHKNVQQFTEMCLDCGRNIYAPDDEEQEYLDAKEKVKRYEKKHDIKKDEPIWGEPW